MFEATTVTVRVAVVVFYGSLSNPVDEEITSPIFRRRFLVPSHSQAT